MSSEAKQAIPQHAPQSPVEFIREVRAETNPAMSPEEDIERKLAAIAEMEGWKILKERIQEKIDRIRNLRDTSDIYEMSEAEIGKRFVVASLVAENLEWIIDSVETPANYHAQKDSKD